MLLPTSYSLLLTSSLKGAYHVYIYSYGQHLAGSSLAYQHSAAFCLANGLYQHSDLWSIGPADAGHSNRAATGDGRYAPQHALSNRDPGRRGNGGHARHFASAASSFTGITQLR